MPFPFPQSACTYEATQHALTRTYALLRPIIDNPTPDVLQKSVISPIGDPIDGHEALIRVAQHASCHTGQIRLIRMSQGW